MIIIGGVGGSGTRLAAQLVESAGVDLRPYVGFTYDNLPMDTVVTRLLDDWLIRGRIDPARKQAVIEKTTGSGKVPRSVWIYPFLKRWVPNLRFLHVVRDGRDMVYSKNQYQFSDLGPKLGLGKRPADFLNFWAIGNLMARHQPCAAYLLVRYEDLVEGKTEPLERWLGKPVDRSLIREGKTVGRYRKKNPKLWHPALRIFGYGPEEY